MKNPTVAVIALLIMNVNADYSGYDTADSPSYKTSPNDTTYHETAPTSNHVNPSNETAPTYNHVNPSNETAPTYNHVNPSNETAPTYNHETYSDGGLSNETDPVITNGYSDKEPGESYSGESPHSEIKGHVHAEVKPVKAQARIKSVKAEIKPVKAQPGVKSVKADAESMPIAQTQTSESAAETGTEKEDDDKGVKYGYRLDADSSAIVMSSGMSLTAVIIAFFL